jgi:Beta-ketoacyl synthase, N-terminal domain
MTLSAYVSGIGVLGPGLADWDATTAVLAGRAPYCAARTVLLVPTLLPSAERRRTGRVVKLALAVALEATGRAGTNPAELASVFSSSGGDGDNCHDLCQALALEGREISPTKFANSVHNAAAGYWSIATGAKLESSVLCAFDASFCAGLLEAMTYVRVDGESVLLVAYDTEYPEPIHSVRPVPDAFGAALVLTPRRTPTSLARIDLTLAEDPEDTMADPAFEAMRASIPAARCLPLLRQLALGVEGTVVLEYLDVSRVVLQVEPCI